MADLTELDRLAFAAWRASLARYGEHPSVAEWTEKARSEDFRSYWRNIALAVLAEKARGPGTQPETIQ